MSDMDERPETGGLARLIASAPAWARLATLGVAAIAGLSGLYLSWPVIASEPDRLRWFVLVPGLAILMVTIGVWVLVRSIALAALAAASLFVCVLWVGGLLALQGVADGAPLFFTIGLMLVLAPMLFVLDRFVAAICSGEPMQGALARAIGHDSRGATQAFVAGLAGLVGVLLFEDNGRGAMFAAWFVAAGAFVVLPLGAGLLNYDENAVARANRAREAWDRALHRFARLAEARWAYALSGSVAVLAAILLSEGRGGLLARMAEEQEGWFAAGAGFAAMLGVAALAFRGDIRALTAFGLFTALVFGFAAAAIDASTGAVPATAAFAAFLVAPSGLLIASRLSDQLRRHEAPEIAYAITLTEAGAPVLVALVIGLGGFAAWGARDMQTAVLAASLVELAGAFALLPALMSAFERLFPRHRSADEIFGRPQTGR